MGATLSLGWFVPGWMYFAHIGDSRIYYLPAEGGMTQVTHDDSHVGWLRRKGEINERQQRTHPQKNMLSKALGAKCREADPQVGAVSCQPGDRFLFCSDGLNDGVLFFGWYSRGPFAGAGLNCWVMRQEPVRTLCLAEQGMRLARPSWVPKRDCGL